MRHRVHYYRLLLLTAGIGLGIAAIMIGRNHIPQNEQAAGHLKVGFITGIVGLCLSVLSLIITAIYYVIYGAFIFADYAQMF